MDIAIGAPKPAVVRLAYMEKWAERIAERMAERGVSDSELSAAIKVKQPSLLQWFKGYSGKPHTKMITAANLLAVSRYLELSPEWILTGRGSKELSQYMGLDTHKLAVAIVSAREAAKGLGLKMDEVQAAPVIAYAYRELALHYPPVLDKAQMQEFDGAIRSKLRGEMHEEVQAAEAAQRSASGAGPRRTSEPATTRAKARPG